MPTILPSAPRSIAIVPARIGSKRIPRKNIRDFGGQPILTYPIKAALESGLFERVVVSSDSDQVGSIAARLGAIYHRRITGLSDDSTSMYAVVSDVLLKYAAKGELYDYVCMLYATAPFVTASRLQEGYKFMLDGYQFVFPAYATPHPERSLYYNGHSMVPRFPHEFNMPSNNFPDSYHPAEGWWWAQSVALELYKGFWGDRNKGILVAGAEAMVIDTDEDWVEAESRHRMGKVG